MAGHHHAPPDPNRRRHSRRAVLASAGAGIAALAGCSGSPGAGEPADPVSLTGGKTCDNCGMVIADHPGPNGQIFYPERNPEDHDNPARFDSLRGCLFPYYFEHERLDWEATAVYVTDYSLVEFDVSTKNGAPSIESFANPESFARATDVDYVAESGVIGAMGPDFVPFSDRGDATAFRDEYGGRIVSFDDVDPAMLA